jgi:hypothetical protein
MKVLIHDKVSRSSSTTPFAIALAANKTFFSNTYSTRVLKA